MGRARKLLILVCLNVVVGVVVLEVGVRWLGLVPDQFFMPDATTGVSHIPRKVGRWTSSGFDVQIRINAHGFRDREREERKPAGTWRAVVLGDSITEAFQVPLEQTFVSVLERRLNTPAHPAEVLNLGISSIGTAQEYLVFKRYGVRYSPNLVILAFFTANDFRNNSRRLESDAHLRYPVPTREGGLARDGNGDIVFTQASHSGALKGFLRANVRSYRFLSDTAKGIEPVLRAFYRRADSGKIADTTDADDRSYGVYRRDPSPAWQEAVAITFDMIEELDRIVRRSGATLFVLVVPGPWEVDPVWAGRTPMTGDGWSVERPERLLMEFLKSRRLPALAVSDVFREYVRRGTDVYSPHDGHLSAAGHRLVGDRLAEALEPQGLAPSGRQ